MNTYIALLRAVNVGGTGKLPMAELRTLCESAGFKDVRTYIASGNVLLRSDSSFQPLGPVPSLRQVNTQGSLSSFTRSITY